MSVPSKFHWIIRKPGTVARAVVQKLCGQRHIAAIVPNSSGSAAQVSINVDTSIDLGFESCPGGPDLVVAHFEWRMALASSVVQTKLRATVIKHGPHEIQFVPTFLQLAGAENESIMDAGPISE